MEVDYRNLVSSMFLVAAPTIDWATLRRLERYFSLGAAFRTSYFVHCSTAHSFLTHTLTPLLRLVTRQIILRSRIRSVPRCSHIGLRN